jgi:hypothetical protein
MRNWLRTHTLDTIRLRVVARRPEGTDADVEDLERSWRRLWDLDCGHVDECDDYLERNGAVNDATERVSVRQEGAVFRRLIRQGPDNPPRGLEAPVTRR